MSSETRVQIYGLEYQGWLDKWASYLKGYCRRWFVLRDGKLSYYKQEDEGETPRDTINLVDAVIMLDEPQSIVVSDNEMRSFHLRATTEKERQEWLTALELSKSRAINKEEEMEQEKLRQASLNSNSDVNTAKFELQNVLERMKTILQKLVENSENASRIAETLPDDTDQTSTNHYSAERQTLDDINQWLHDLQSSTNELVISSTNNTSEHHSWKQMMMERERRENLERSFESLARKYTDFQEAVLEFKWLTMKYGCEEARDNSSEETNKAMDYIIRSLGGRTSRMSIVSRCSSNKLFPSTSWATALLDETDTTVRQETQLLTRIEDLEEDDEFLDEEFEEIAKDFEESDSSRDPEPSNITRATGSRYVLTRTDGTATVNKQKLQEYGKFRKRRSTIFSGKVTEVMPIIIAEDRDTSTKRVRRTTIPERPNIQTSIWSVLKNCIGKDLAKISMPITLSEPLSALQRLTEEYEYSELLDLAALCDDSCEQMVYITAFAVSSACATSLRTAKPFNPLLGETFECDRTEDLGWRCISEQVSHHPAVAGQHCESRGWKCWQEFVSNVKFMGQYIRLTPLGINHLEFTSTGYHYTWRKVPTTLHNLIVGTIVVENHGDMTITNHTTGEKSCLNFHPYKHFSWETPCKVSGAVLDKFGAVTWVLNGRWNEYMEAELVIHRGESKRGKPILRTTEGKLIWKRRVPAEEYKSMYSFSPFTCQLNEPEPGVAPTDSRHRPDIRSMENGDFDAAAEFKLQLEDIQRSARKKLEKEAELAMAEGRPFLGYKPAWFNTQKDPITGKPIFVYAGQYWECKERQDWSKCPDIFL